VSAQVRVVSDPYPTVGATRCLADRGDWLCWLEIGHDGECLPLPRKNWEPTK
jgi:hypothetical protein